MKTENKLPLRFSKGKFMRGEIEELPEIGNIEQIEVLRRYARDVDMRQKAATDGEGLPVEMEIGDITYDAICEFTCVCGEVISSEKRDHAHGLDGFINGNRYTFDSDIIKCHACGRLYMIKDTIAKIWDIDKEMSF